jgi:hypothetical protein
MKLFPLTSLLVLASMLGSCSKMNQLEQRTKRLEKTSKHSSKASQDVRDITELMFKQTRQNSTKETRATQWQILMNAGTLAEKIVAAESYFKNFEYQLWNNKNFDTLVYREALIRDALSEFYQNLAGIVHDLGRKAKNGKLSPLHQRKGQNTEMVLHALAATIHLTNPYQDLVLKRSSDNPFQKLSLYDVVSEILISYDHPAVSEGASIIHRSLNRDNSILLLQARVNTLVYQGLEHLATRDGMNVLDKFNSLIFKSSVGVIGKISLQSRFSETTHSTHNYIVEIFKEALKTKQVLGTLGAEAELDKALHSKLEHLDLSSDVENVTPETREALGQLMLTIDALIDL